MSTNSKLSDKSREFIEDLRVYLFSSGKRWDEIDEIGEELESHLSEAEREGKSVEKIIGNSPKAYMQSIAGEMAIDYRSWIKYIFIIIFGSFSFTVARDLVEGSLAYSVLEIAGHVVIGVLFIATLFVAFRYISGENLSSIKQMLIISIPGVLPIALFVGLIYLNRIVDTPVIHFRFWGTVILALITLIFLIAVSIWAKTWVAIILITLSTLPDYLLGLTALQEETQLIWSTIILLGGFGLYFWILMKLEKKEG
ncbi:hypothetical protein WMZ97_08265 [Lentibacillus sp. N15]|uniref:HAAS domain-containing protein n=1 Tax=Lentibacillus songyuanensis TaxID=3136161 RepID=UPI0031BA0E19